MFSIKKNRLEENKMIMKGALECPRYEELPGDDMDEVEPPPGWNALSDSEKKDILDSDMDYYWLGDSYPLTWNNWVSVSFVFLKPVVFAIFVSKCISYIVNFL